MRGLGWSFLFELLVGSECNKIQSMLMRILYYFKETLKVVSLLEVITKPKDL